MISSRPISAWRYPDAAFRLDSAPASSAYSQWSYRLGPPALLIRCDARTRMTTLTSAAGTVREWADPLKALAWMASRLTTPAAPGPPFKGGWVGYLSYDFGRLLDAFPPPRADTGQPPLFAFTWHGQVDAHAPAAGLLALDLDDAESPSLALPRPARVNDEPLRSAHSPGSYRAAVGRVIEYIRAGDVFQVNLSQTFTAGLGRRSPMQIYDALRERFPAWFGAYLDFGDWTILSNSPELFLRVSPAAGGRRLMTRPIKGTRPLGKGMDAELRDSAKDQAELNMIVDLERNDLGRVCQIGSVRVTEPRAIESHATVYHGAATIEGALCDDVGLVELLRAAFPGGSITGAPKIRAAQIIDELEPAPRGIYCGAIGYLSVDGHMQFNVAIRTMTIDPAGRIHIPVGGGIVADSDPTAEYEETLVKARAMFAVLGIAGPPLAQVHPEKTP